MSLSLLGYLSHEVFQVRKRLTTFKPKSHLTMKYLGTPVVVSSRLHFSRVGFKLILKPLYCAYMPALLMKALGCFTFHLTYVERGLKSALTQPVLLIPLPRKPGLNRQGVCRATQEVRWQTSLQCR